MKDLLDSRTAWITAWAALAVMSIGYGAPLVVVVAMKPIAGELVTARSGPSGAAALSYIGSAFGGILAGWLAGKFGVRSVVLLGAAMVALGLALSASGGLTELFVGHGLLIGLLGISCLFSPLMTYVSLWFVRRRGSAVALIASGQAVSGAIWPPLLQLGVDEIGWRWTMIWFAALIFVSVVVLALVFLRPPPVAAPVAGAAPAASTTRETTLGLPPNLLQALLMVAVFCCCIPMAMPMNHVVAYCGDLGFASQSGAAMLSVLLGVAFFARQFWGWLADRIGGFQTLLFSSLVQITGLVGYLATQDQVALFVVSAIFGIGLSGLLPSYVIVVRECYTAQEANWRVPTVMFAGFLGMAGGGWLPGELFDRFSSYMPAFGTGLVLNLVNLAVLIFLVARKQRPFPLAAAV
ncbi:MAG: MFS transporter [Alphaproteobacteria bacterium]|nr:MFS transporter [Alphaproteobacteria bacterium]